MNPIAVSHAVTALIIVVLALPLIKRKIKMNRWYGVRIRESFKSEERWFEINEYGGRLMLYWGIVMLLMSLAGVPLEKKHWTVYAWSSLAVVFGGLAVITIMIVRYVARTKRD